jgi:hypothetical protein
MDREPEQRRDLAPAQGENRLGGETFTVIETYYGTSEYSGKRIVTARTECRNVPFGSDRKIS